VRNLGTELWLDTGNIDEIGKHWTGEFSAVTVNNTLLNREIQSGRYDKLIPQAAKIIEEDHSLNERETILEMAYILNGVHGLKLVQKFDAYVSLEEHTDLANDVDLAVEYGRRLYALCPERFYIKIPLTAAGLLATRILSKEKIPVNHTLGFSARQNYMIARIANPAFVNVFLGRLNSFVADNKLGSGNYIGEIATLASQKVISELREKRLSTSQQIGASFRSGKQIRDLAGIDVMTMPPKVAAEFLGLDLDVNIVTSRLETQYKPGINKNVDEYSIGLTTLWDVDEKLVACLDELEEENLDEFTPDDLLDFFEDYDCDDILVRWTDDEVKTSMKEGKIPKLSNWKDALENSKIGLDSLMNLAGLNHFRSDQDETDKRVHKVREDSNVYA
ncbi:MAG: transaldolase family protein, partial [Sedimentisphaerales bacterium]